jgi:hypothetical protein
MSRKRRRLNNRQFASNRTIVESIVALGGRGLKSPRLGARLPHGAPARDFFCHDTDFSGADGASEGRTP